MSWRRKCGLSRTTSSMCAATKKKWKSEVHVSLRTVWALGPVAQSQRCATVFLTPTNWRSSLRREWVDHTMRPSLSCAAPRVVGVSNKVFRCESKLCMEPLKAIDACVSPTPRVLPHQRPQFSWVPCSSPFHELEAVVVHFEFRRVVCCDEWFAESNCCRLKKEED